MTARNFFFSWVKKQLLLLYKSNTTILVLQTIIHPIFAMLNEKKVKKTVENKTCYYYYYYYYYRIIPDYTIILSRKKEIHIVIVLGHIFFLALSYFINYYHKSKDLGLEKRPDYCYETKPDDTTLHIFFRSVYS